MQRPLFAHQLEALRRKQEQDDLEVVGRTPKRRGKGKEPEQGATRGGLTWRTDINWFKPSPLVEWSRGIDGVRVPYVGLTAITKKDIPRGPDGQTLPRYADPRKRSEEHFSYIERQYRLTHIDYIERSRARDTDEDGRYSHVLTNISPNAKKRRYFIRKVYDFEQKPRPPRLRVWSSDLDLWVAAAAKPDAPQWLQDCVGRIQAKIRDAESKGRQVGSLPIDLGVTTPEQAYERLTWCHAEFHESSRPKLDFESQYGGRVQYRWVFELPFGLNARERFEIARGVARWCKAKRFMYVIAIHQPDQHNDNRNYHIHCDFYDRPCRWIKKLQKWDFEVEIKTTKGDWRSCHQDKPIWLNRDPEGRMGYLTYREKVLKLFRQVVVDEANRVLEKSGISTRYHAGPLSELGVDITGTKKLGGPRMAMERIGIETDVGDSNADAIWSDRERAIERAYREGLYEDEVCARELVRQVFETGKAHNESGLQLLGEIEEYRLRLKAVRELRTELERAETAFDKAASRAATVVREASKHQESETGERAFARLTAEQEASLADAHQHLERLGAIGPSEEAKQEVRVLLTSMERDWRQREERIRVALVRLATQAKAREIQLPLEALKGESKQAVFDVHAQHRISRLKRWVAENPDRIRVDADRLVVAAPQAILTIAAKHHAEPEVQNILALVVAKRMVEEGRGDNWPVHMHEGLAKFTKRHFENRELERVLLGRHIAHPDVQAAMCRLRADQAMSALSAMQHPTPAPPGGNSAAPPVNGIPILPAAQPPAPASELDMQAEFQRRQGKGQGR